MLNQPSEVREATTLDALLERNRLQNDRIASLTKKVHEIADRLTGSNPEEATGVGTPTSQTTGGLVGELQYQADALDTAIGRAHRAVDRLAGL